MSSQGKCDWTGRSGTVYTYEIYPIGTNFVDKAGNYIFASRASYGKWAAHYVGQTVSLKDRLGSHEREACAIRQGATHIHAHRSQTLPLQLAEEVDLIASLQPHCNTQGK